MAKNKIIFIALVALLVVGTGTGYWFGSRGGYKTGYAQGQDDIKKLEEEVANKAVRDAAQAANPFQAVNPLEGVEANPFEKAKKVLNPFE
jgi:flagellar basal body-associated protein FliL